MGLIQDDSVHPFAARYRTWVLPGVVILIAFLIAIADDPGRDWLAYDRAAIRDGEIWRLLTGHFTHLGWSHFALNGAGLFLVSYLVAARFTASQWLAITVLTIAGIDLGFWLLQPQLAWYVGLSGVLHGLLVAGVIAGVKQRRYDAAILGGLIVAKLAYEQLLGPLPGSEESSGGAVIVAAHLYGALTAVFTAVWLPVRVPEASL